MATTTSPPMPLESGDRLTRDEFHKRYLARPDIYKAELVDGVVYITTRVAAAHGEATAAMGGWVGTYAAYRPNVRAMLHVTTLMGTNREVQPDVLAFRDQRSSGRVHITPDDYLQGPPDLIIEVATSSASYDLYDKKRIYEQEGVLEYVVWQLFEGRIDWFRLRGSTYIRVEPDADGVIESTTFTGLRLNVPGMLAGDYAGVLAALGQSGADTACQIDTTIPRRRMPRRTLSSSKS
ncbi:MAG: Uma2 family endonuclease [Dehalococcoidia bacterium]